MFDKIEDTFKERRLGTGPFCIEVGVKCWIGKIYTDDMRGKLYAKCTTLFCSVSVQHVANGEKTNYRPI